MNVPSIAYGALSPLLIVFGVALAGVLVEAFCPAAYRRMVQIPLAGGGFVAALIAVILLQHKHEIVASGSVAVDGPALFLDGTILLLAIASLFLLAERSGGGSNALVADAAALPGTREAGELLASTGTVTEAYPLMSFSVAGMMLFGASNSLLTMFVALEVLSLPLYLMAGLARRRRLLSQEAALKYFLLGAFSSAFFLYGLAMVYGFAGSVELGAIHDAVGNTGRTDIFLYLGMAMLAIGLLFKLGAVPFHAWTPDVYQGAPTPVTAFMAAGTKVAAFGALLRTFYVAFGPMEWDWRPIMWVVAILTMVVGAVLAITQTDIKRMLAYSSVAHAGFILVAFTAGTVDSVEAVLFYLLTYGFSIIGAFAIVGLVRNPTGEANHLSSWAGLGRRAPFLAGTFTFFLLAFAGIPLTSGFMAKFYVFRAGVDGGAAGLVVIGVITSAVTAFFYVRVIILMYFVEPADDGTTVALPSAFASAAVGLGLAVTLVLGVVPAAVIDIAHNASTFARLGS
ncbi:MAG TPA: NADH-quinone oxidoreductase subunit NuoN [Mycobacteriales bacterium]